MKIHIELPDEIHYKFKAKCCLNKTSMTSVIGDLIQKYLFGDVEGVNK